MIIKEWHLHYCAGTSDKVYIARIEKRSDGFYGVPCEYGRRGGTLKPADKGIYRTLPEAELMFDKVVSEKTAKGYSVTERKTVSEADPDLVSAVKSALAKSKRGLKLDELAKEVEETLVVSSTESKECSEGAREKALARLKASSVW